MGKKNKAHRERVKKRNLMQEEKAWWQWETLQQFLKDEGYASVEEAIEKEPGFAPRLAPFALRAWKLTTQNLKKYGNKPV